MGTRRYCPGRLLFANLTFLFIICAFTFVSEIVFPAQITAENSKPAGEPAAVARGHVVYRDHCAICHFSQSEALKIGPGLKKIYKRGRYASGGKIDDASMEKWIESGGKNMPPFRMLLKAEQIRDLIAYLKTL